MLKQTEDFVCSNIYLKPSTYWPILHVRLLFMETCSQYMCVRMRVCMCVCVFVCVRVCVWAHVCMCFQLRRAYENEYKLLATLPFHDNIIRLLAFFYDRVSGNLPGIDHFDVLRNHRRKLSMFLVMDFLPVTLEALSEQYRNSRRLTVGKTSEYWTTQAG